MLNLRKNPAPSEPPPPADTEPDPMVPSVETTPATMPKGSPDDTLLIAWLDGCFTAQVAHRGVAGRSWTRNSPAQSPAEFRGAIAEAIRQTEFQGKSVSVLLAHNSLAPSRIEAPANQRLHLARFIRSQVDRLNPFPGTEPIWSFRPSVAETAQGRLSTWSRDLLRSVGIGPHPPKRSAILYILSRTLHDDIVEACRHSGLVLRQIIPVTEALLQLSNTLPFASDQLHLVASAWPEGTAVALIRHGGTAELVRVLDEPSIHSAESVVDFIQSHLHFAENILRQPISGIHLFGTITARFAPEIGVASHGLPIDIQQPDSHDEFWTRALLQLGNHHPVNLVTPEIRRAPSRRIVRRTMAWVGVSTVSASAALAYLAERHGEHLRSEIARSEKSITEHTRNLSRLQQEVAALESKWNFIKALPGETRDPVPLWFLAHLGEATPRDLWISRVFVHSQSNEWSLNISGQQQPNVPAYSPEDMKRVIRDFARQLAEGPLSVQVRQDTSFGSSRPVRPGSPVLSPTLERIIGSSPNRSGLHRPFELEGTLR